MRQIKSSHLSVPVDYAVGIFLAVIGFLISWAFAQRYDVFICDEFTYALAGNLWPRIHLLSNWAPLYSLWHALLSVVAEDRLKEYLLNVTIQTTCFFILLFFVLRRLNCSVRAAVAAVMFLGMSYSVVEECPRVQIFCLNCLFAGVLAILSLDRPVQRMALYSVLLFGCSYIRPELTVGAGATFLLLVVKLLRESELFAQDARASVLAAVLILVLFFGFGNPASDPQYERATESFGEMYTGVFTETPRIPPPGLWKQAMIHDFGFAPTFPEALRANPLGTLEAVISNAKSFGYALKLDILGKQMVAFRCVAALALAFGLMLFIATVREYFFGPEFCLFLSAALSSCLVIFLSPVYPRHAFFVLTSVALAFAAAIRKEPLRFQGPRDRCFELAILCSLPFSIFTSQARPRTSASSTARSSTEN